MKVIDKIGLDTYLVRMDKTELCHILGHDGRGESQPDFAIGLHVDLHERYLHLFKVPMESVRAIDTAMGSLGKAFELMESAKRSMPFQV